MQFLMLVWDDPTADAYVPAEDNIEAWVKENDAAGRRRDGDRLQAPQDGRTVRVRSGKLLVTEGPFVETQEQIAGFDLLECADLDEAVEGRRRPPDGAVRHDRGAPALDLGGLSTVLRGARVVAWAPRTAHLWLGWLQSQQQSSVRTNRRTP